MQKEKEQPEPLLEERYKTNLNVEVDDLTSNEFQKNWIFYKLVELGKVELLRQLVQFSTSDFIKAINNNKNFPHSEINNKDIARHSINFPNSYTLSDKVKKHISFYLVLKKPGWYRNIEEERLRMQEFLVNQGADAIIFLLVNQQISLEHLKNLIDWGYNVDNHYKGNTALHIVSCSSKDRIKKMELLLEHGANPNIVDESGVGTVLHILLANEAFLEAKALINKAKETLDPNTVDNEGKTPLILATRVLDYSSVSLLLQFENTEVNAQDQFGRTALHYACILGQIDIADLLLGRHADANIKDSRGYTPLHYLVAKKEIRKVTARFVLSSKKYGIEIHGGRNAHARLNCVTNYERMPVAIGDHQLLATKENVSIAIDFLHRNERDEEEEFLEHVSKSFSEDSLLEACLNKDAQLQMLTLILALKELDHTNVDKAVRIHGDQNQKIADLLNNYQNGQRPNIGFEGSVPRITP